MTIDSIDVDLENVFSLSQWLEREDARNIQRHLEEKIMALLFSHDPAGSPFQRMVTELAWIGARRSA